MRARDQPERRHRPFDRRLAGRRAEPGELGQQLQRDLAVPTVAGVRHDRRERAHPCRVLDGDGLGDHAAHRDADHVRATPLPSASSSPTASAAMSVSRYSDLTLRRANERRARALTWLGASPRELGGQTDVTVVERDHPESSGRRDRRRTRRASRSTGRRDPSRAAAVRRHPDVSYSMVIPLASIAGIAAACHGTCHRPAFRYAPSGKVTGWSMSCPVRVISRQRTIGARRGALDRLEEVGRRNPARARSLHEHPTRRDEPNGVAGQPCVRPEGPLDVRLALGERGRVDDDQAEATLLPTEIGHHLEGVADPRVVGAGAAPRRASDSVPCCARRRPSVGADRSTLSTDRAPPAAACTLNPPLAANTSSTSMPAVIAPTSIRFARWSRNQPVFCAVPHVRLEREAGLTEHDCVIRQLAGDHVPVGQAERFAACTVRASRSTTGRRHRRAGDIEQGRARRRRGAGTTPAE